MDNLINIPEKYKIKMNRARDKKYMDNIYGNDNSDIAALVEQFSWLACMKPALGNVIPTRTESVRYDELQIFHIKISDLQKLYQICVPVYKKIKYPCLLLVQYEEKYTFSACKFSAGKINYDDNVNRQIAFTHWIFPDAPSEKAMDFVNRVNDIISCEGDLYTLYTNLFDAISYFHIYGITKNHIIHLIEDMLGKTTIPKSFWAKLSPYKKYDLAWRGKNARYQKRKGSYTYRYDTEDLWHAFLSDERLRKVIIGRRYRDVDDLIRTIDSKYELEWEP